MEKESKAYEARLKLYLSVEKVYKFQNRYGTITEMLAQTKKEPVLAKVYLLCVCHVHELKQHKKSSMLYDAVTYSYLHTFGDVRDGKQYDRKLLIQIRKTLATIERCLRFIKADHPHLFNYDLIQETNKRRKENIDSFGNESVLHTDIENHT